MSIISIIVAVDENNAIGKDNKLLCHLPNDLKYFKSVTQGHTVIMGRKTFESLPNGALPNRRNLVISRNKSLHYDRAEIFPSLEDALNTCKNEEEVFVIGGATIYREAMPLADKLYITVIHHEFEGADTFFPVIDNTEWKEISVQKQSVDEKNKYNHSFIIYTRIS